jgi:hypothetical protein
VRGQRLYACITEFFWGLNNVLNLFISRHLSVFSMLCGYAFYASKFLDVFVAIPVVEAQREPVARRHTDPLRGYAGA